jgi:membrane protein CcdC involved in cytochrome C biogenesis|tara:strand:- start:225 stop:383 length:159 start_codon:yes stop_codon:yes gene_type:complete
MEFFIWLAGCFIIVMLGVWLAWPVDSYYRQKELHKSFMKAKKESEDKQLKLF